MPFAPAIQTSPASKSRKQLGSGIVVVSDHTPGLLVLPASRVRNLTVASPPTPPTLLLNSRGKPKNGSPVMRIAHSVIAPVASVENSINGWKMNGNELFGVKVTAPSAKLKNLGNIVTKERFGGRGCAKVNDPVILHTGGHAKFPGKESKALPVYVYMVSALAEGAKKIATRENASKAPTE